MTDEVAFRRKRLQGVGFMLALLLVLAGCAQAPQREGPVAKGDYGFLAKYLDWMIAVDMHRWSVPGVSVAVIDDQNVVWSKGYGFADVANAVPATPATLYRVGSVSKLVTAVEVMRRVDRGEIDLDRPLVDELPDFSIHSRFKDAQPITVRALLAHHSGLPSDYLRGMWEADPVSLAQLQSALREERLASPPQTQYKYSNLDYSLLGRLIELESGEPFAAAMERHLLRPLGMDRSSFERNAQSPLRYAKGYRKGGELPPIGLRDEPAGALISSVTDMARFVAFALADGEAGGKRLLGAESLAAMFEPQFSDLPLDFGHRMGLGWMLSGLDVPAAGPIAWHTGAYIGYYGTVLVSRREKLGVVLLANDDGAGKFATQVALKALELALEAKQGKRAAPKSVSAAARPIEISAKRIDDYTGDYVVFGTKSRISRQDDKLVADLFRHKVDLVPVANDRFVVKKTVLGLVEIPLPQMSVHFTAVAGRRFAVLEGLPGPFAFERIEKGPIPRAWQARLGPYRCSGSDATLELHRFDIEVEDGMLVVQMEASSRMAGYEKSAGSVALDPVSDTEAVVVGVGTSEGLVLHATRIDGHDRVTYYGYPCTRVDSGGVETDSGVTARKGINT